MTDCLQDAVARIRAVGEVICEEQMYCFPGFDSIEDDPDDFFSERGVEFDGVLFVRFPARLLYKPIPMEEIEEEEQLLGVELPTDYKSLLATFGEFYVPGDHIGSVLYRPIDAHEDSGNYGYPDSAVTALTIARYNDVSDGNAIGYICQDGRVLPQLFRFEHELQYDSANPMRNVQKVGESLSQFLIEYLDRNHPD